MLSATRPDWRRWREPCLPTGSVTPAFPSHRVVSCWACSAAESHWRCTQYSMHHSPSKHTRPHQDSSMSATDRPGQPPITSPQFHARNFCQLPYLSVITRSRIVRRKELKPHLSPPSKWRVIHAHATGYQHGRALIDTAGDALSRHAIQSVILILRSTANAKAWFEWSHAAAVAVQRRASSAAKALSGS